MGRAGRPSGEGKIEFDPLRELEEEGLPPGWMAYWQGERGEAISSAIINIFENAGYEVNSNHEIYMLSRKGKLDVAEQDAFLRSLPLLPGRGGVLNDYISSHKGFARGDYTVHVWQERDRFCYNIFLGKEIIFSGAFREAEQETAPAKIEQSIDRLVDMERDRAMRSLAVQQELMANYPNADDHSELLIRSSVEWFEGKTIDENGSFVEDGDPGEKEIFRIAPSAYGQRIREVDGKYVWEVKYPSGWTRSKGESDSRYEAEKSAGIEIAKAVEEALENESYLDDDIL